LSNLFFILCLAGTAFAFKKNKLKTKSAMDIDQMHGFKCYSQTGMDVPIRLNDNYQVECLSSGNYCVTGIVTDQDCLNLAGRYNQVSSKSCGTPGPHGYTPGTICQKGWEYFYNKWHCQNETGLAVGLHLNKNTNNVECLTVDDRTCSTNPQDCLEAQAYRPNDCPNEPSSQSQTFSAIECKFDNKTNQSRYFSDDAQWSWCQQGEAFFRSHGLGEWYCAGDLGLNIDLPFQMNSQGNMACFSQNGQDCSWGHGTNSNGNYCNNWISGNIQSDNPGVCNGDSGWCGQIAQWFYRNQQGALS